jgi:hypothetical protein
MSKNGRQTIGTEFMEQLNDSPLDLLTAPKADKEMSEKKTKFSQESKEDFKVPKERMTIQISKDTIERVKDAVYWTPGLTVAQLTEEALEHALDRLEKKNGKTFEKRKSQLKPGRPIK